MQITKEQLSPTKVKLTISADAELLEKHKSAAVQVLGKQVKVPGFRNGSAPVAMVEKQLDQGVLQTEVLQAAVNEMFGQAAADEGLRVMGQPEIAITKFVPFSTLEITAEVDVLGPIKLGDYKKLGIKKPEAKVADKQIDDVLTSLQERGAERTEVKRAAKMGDEVTLDFTGVDAKTKEAIDGAAGKDFPLTLGSKSFIPGFEEAVVGLKPGDSKDFDVTFPADYGVKDLQKRKVTFSITAHKVAELAKPELNDEFASKIGPFKTLDDLKKDIRRELEAQAAREADQAWESQLLEKIASKTTLDVPAALTEQELDAVEQQERQNVMYRGQTWQEHLAAEGVTEEEHRTKNKPVAELRVKSGLILAEIAEQEKIDVTPEELEIRLQLLKGRYASDEKMMEELDKPENRRDLVSRLLTEKTLAKLKELQ